MLRAALAPFVIPDHDEGTTMVQVHAAKPAFERPDPVRIAAMSGALSLNLAGLFLLLIPIVMPSAPARVEPPARDRTWVDFIPVKPKPVPTVLPPIPPAPPIEHVTPPPPVRTTTIEAPTTTEPVDASNVVAPPPIDTPNVSSVPSGPIEVGALGTRFASAPKYPIPELKRGIEGTVMLRILVGTDGTPLQVDIERSSGSRGLDRAAREHVLKKWRFQPAMQDGVPVQAWGRVPIVFTLGRA